MSASGPSRSSQATSTTTTSIADSYNSAFNAVYNIQKTVDKSIHDSGNVTITLPDDGSSQLGKVLPYLLGMVGILALVLLFK